MKAVDVVAWGETLGVHAKEIPWALTARIRQVEELHAALTRLKASLREAPDEDLMASLVSACRCMGEVGDRLNDSLSDIRRGE